MAQENERQLNQKELENILSLEDNVDTIKMKEQIIKTKKLPLELVKLAYNKSKDKNIKEALLNKYLTVYPELLIFIFSPNNSSDRKIIENILNKKIKKFNEKYLDEVFNIIESEEYSAYYKTDLIWGLIDIAEQRDDLSKDFYKRLISLASKQFVGKDIVEKIYQKVKDDPELSAFFLQKMLEYDYFEKLLTIGSKSKWVVENIVKEIITKNLNATMMINILANLQKRPEGQLFLLNYIPNDSKYLKVFMYLSRSPDERIKNLAKEKIKSLKS